MGYVQHQRYMGAHHRSSFAELRDWLRKYSDHPNAMEIYNLGLKRGARAELVRPRREAARPLAYTPRPPANYDMIQYMRTYRGYAKKERDDVMYLLRIFNRRLREGKPDEAREILERKGTRALFARNDYLRMQAHLARAYFFNGQDDMAILWARTPAQELDYYIADWTLGLAHWRQGDYLKSRDYFKRIAHTLYLPVDVKTGAAYWAWRANERVPRREREDGDALLKIAAEFPKSFYGILANRRLASELRINWDEPQFTLAHAQEITSWQGGLRSLALLQVGMKREAAAELRFLVNTDSETSDRLVGAVIALAGIAGMPGLSINLASTIPEYADDKAFASPHYPILDIAIAGGWKIDQALINAIIRQESRFNPMAKSHAGARGILQVMPATASFITGDPSLRKTPSKLFDEERNLEIGQIYLEYLLSKPAIDGNLIKALVAYNAGPGNLARQESRIVNPEDDPLFFLESISIQETRIYIRRVMSNFWLYRNRMGMRCESLEYLIQDRWPMYYDRSNYYRPRLTDEQIRQLESYLNTLESTSDDDEENGNGNNSDI
jgi:soluble lytic murein transglycosylase-like protein